MVNWRKSWIMKISKESSSRPSPNYYSILLISDKVQDIVYSKRGHNIVNSKVAMYLENATACGNKAFLTLVSLDLNLVEKGFPISVLYEN